MPNVRIGHARSGPHGTFLHCAEPSIPAGSIIMEFGSQYGANAPGSWGDIRLISPDGREYEDLWMVR